MSSHRLLLRRTPISRLGGVLGVGGAALLAGRISQNLEEQAADTAEHHHVVVVGGGSGGVGVAAQLRNAGEKDITIIEPSETHYYQPLWTLVGGGIYRNTRSARPMRDCIPRRVGWLQDSVVKFDPEKNQVVTSSGKTVSYDYLVVATGLTTHWDKIKGLKETFGENGVVSIYDYEGAADTWETIQNLKKGRLIFTQPATPVKCGGAPQKIMWLTEDYVRRQGRRGEFDIIFAIPQNQMFGVKRYSNILDRIREERDVKAMYGLELIEVDGPKKMAIFKNVKDGSQCCMKFEMLHCVAPMTAPDVVRTSPLADENGWVSVDKHTLQHVKYPNVFSLGDCSSCPNSKTIAAITSQAPVLVHNLQQHQQGRPLTASYDGYASCPIVLGYTSLLLAEFKYGGVPSETFSKYIDQSKPRYIFMLMKKYVFPAAYWNLYLSGHWFGPKGIVPPKFESPPGQPQIPATDRPQ